VRVHPEPGAAHAGQGPRGEGGSCGIRAYHGPIVHGGALSLDELKSSIDRVLAEFLDERRAEAAAIEGSATALVDEVSRVVEAGGRRLRPAFCYWGHLSAGAPHSEAILRSAASLELLHAFAILHDDVMDRAEVRRGEPAAFRRLAGERAASGARGDALHFGISVAILAGDLAFALSDTLLLASGFPPGRIAAATGILHDMRVRAVAGQFLDLSGAGRPVLGAGSPNADEVRRIARLKTAAYSVEGPLLLGATLGGGGEDLERRLRAYGVSVGEALQLRDDLMGLFGDPRQTGKDTETDIRQGTPTLLLAEALRRGEASERRLIADLWGRADLGADEVDAVRTAIAATGAPEAILSLIDELVAEAIDVLRPLPAEACAVLSRLALLVGRGAGAREPAQDAPDGEQALR
jgi:geranylgeranyl diphosphate synthase, type I